MVDAADVDPVSVGASTSSEAEEEDRDEDGQSHVDPRPPIQSLSLVLRRNQRQDLYLLPSHRVAEEGTGMGRPR